MPSSAACSVSEGWNPGVAPPPHAIQGLSSVSAASSAFEISMESLPPTRPNCGIPQTWMLSLEWKGPFTTSAPANVISPQIDVVLNVDTLLQAPLRKSWPRQVGYSALPSPAAWLPQ